MKCTNELPAGWLVGAALVSIALLVGLQGCLPELPPPQTDRPPLEVGQSAEVELVAVRLDVNDFEEVITRERIAALPASARDNLWLFDLDLRGGAGTPKLLDNAIAQLRSRDPNDPSLGPAERNLIRLLTMTPESADVTGTALAELLALAPQVGFSPADILAEALGITPSDPILPEAALAEALASHVVASHPAASRRRGAPTLEHPDGWIPVKPGSLPITLEDVASNFASLSRRFGPTTSGSTWHPGLVVGATAATALQDDFAIRVKASTNALPFKGIDLTNVSIGSVSAVASEGARLFDVADPDWLRVDGLLEEIRVQSLTLQILEHPAYHAPGNSTLPAPWGNSTVWLTPHWTLEHVVAQSALLHFRHRQFNQSWALIDPAQPLFSLNIDSGWLELTTQGNLGQPPPPLYLWDLTLDVAQARLHDNPAHPEPLPEGTAHVQLTLKDVPVGISHTEIVNNIRNNFEHDPAALSQLAGTLLPQTTGAVDFYHYQPRAGGPPDQQGDWLFFLAPSDIPTGADGTPVRDYARYEKPGFWADPALTLPIHSKTPVDGDTSHLKVKVQPGDILYVADDNLSLFHLQVLAKPSLGAIRLKITRER